MAEVRDSTDVALGYVRKEIEHLRTGLAEQMRTMSSDISGLSASVHAFVADQNTRTAVLEHRATASEEAMRDLKTQHAKDIGDVRAEHATAMGELRAVLDREKTDREQREDVERRFRAQMMLALVICVLGALLSWLPDIIK